MTASSLTVGSTSETRTYTYEADSNRKSVIENNVPTAYYFYDATDAVITKNTTNTAPTVGTACGSLGFCYDAQGDLTASSPSTPDSSAIVATTYTYDPAGHLTGLVAGSQTIGYAIDALGRHRSQTISGSTTTYGYVGTSDSIVSMSATGSTTFSTIDAIGDRLATKVGSTSGYLVADLHGNVIAATSAAASPLFVRAYRYDAYGETCASWYSSTGAIAVPWRFQGRVLESGSGTDLYEFGARSYDPSLGAFTSFDSVAGSAQNPLTLNRYLYAAANPATLVDPDGHKSCSYVGGGSELYCTDTSYSGSELTTTTTTTWGMTSSTTTQVGNSTTWTNTTGTTTEATVSPAPGDLVVSGVADVAATVSTIQLNNAQGKAAEQEMLDRLKAEFPADDYTIIQQRTLKNEGKSILVNGNSRGKMWDFLVVNRHTGRVVLAEEMKSGSAEEYKFDIRTSAQVIDQIDTVNAHEDAPVYRLAYKNVETEAIDLYGVDWVNEKLGVSKAGTAADADLQAKIDGLSRPAEAEGAGGLGALEALSGVGGILVGVDMILEGDRAHKAELRRERLIEDLTAIGQYDPDFANTWMCSLDLCM